MCQGLKRMKRWLIRAIFIAYLRTFRILRHLKAKISRWKYTMPKSTPKPKPFPVIKDSKGYYDLDEDDNNGT